MKKKSEKQLAEIRVVSEVAGNRTRHHDLDALAGSWIEDKAVDKALRMFERVHEARRK